MGIVGIWARPQDQEGYNYEVPENPLVISRPDEPIESGGEAAAGEGELFTGISSPYEAPLNPEIVVDTGSLDLNDSVEKIINYLKKENFLNKA